jgi:hypothetical protein
MSPRSRHSLRRAPQNLFLRPKPSYLEISFPFTRENFSSRTHFQNGVTGIILIYLLFERLNVRHIDNEIVEEMFLSMESDFVTKSI